MKHPFVHVFAAIFFALAGAKAFAQANVITDQSDYPPGSTVHISGSGFQPGETVHLQVLTISNPSDNGDEHQPWTVAADSEGDFQTTWYVTTDEINQTLQLTATGLVSHLTAQTTFTDGDYGTLTVGIQSGSLTNGVAGTVSFGITLSGKTGGNSVGVNLAVSGLPSGVTAGFSPNNFNSSSSSTSSTLHVTNSASTPAGPYTITVTDNSTPSGTGTLTILTSRASKLAFTTQPANTTAGVTMANVVVQLQDANGNNISSNNVPITLTLNSGSFAGGSTTTVNSDATGKSTFSNLKINASGAYTMTASASGIGTGLSSATSGSFIIKPSVATTLTVAGYPSPRIAGQPGTLTVTAKDSFGNVATNYTGTVHLTSSDGAATLAANHQFTTADTGIYQFTGNIFRTAGTQSITATDLNTNSITGTQSSIVIIGDIANRLIFIVQPVNTTNGATMANVIVQIQDQFSNNIANSGTNISLALIGGGALGGTTNQTTDANGRATFNNLNVMGAGAGNFLTAFSATLTGATSNPFNVAKAGTANAVSVSTNPSPTGSNVTLTATISVIAPGSGSPGGTVQFLADGSPIGSPATVSGGIANLTIASLAHGSHTITAQYAGDGDFFGSTNSLGSNLLINTSPTAGTFTLTTMENTSASFAAAKLTGAAKDADHDALSLNSVNPTSAHGGAVSLVGGTITYLPPTNYAGADSFNYVIADTFGATTNGTVSVTVNATPSGQTLNITSLTIQPGGAAKLQFAGIPRRVYLVQATTNIVSPVWTTIATNTAGVNGLSNFIDTDAPNYPTRYYRTAAP